MRIQINNINFNIIKNRSPIIHQVYDGIFDVHPGRYSMRYETEVKEKIEGRFKKLLNIEYPKYEIEVKDKESNRKKYKLKIISYKEPYTKRRYIEINENKILRKKSKNYDRILIKDLIDVESVLKSIKKNFNKFIEETEIKIQMELENYINSELSDKIDMKILKILEIKKVYEKLNTIEEKREFLKNLGFDNTDLIGYYEIIESHIYGKTYFIDWNNKNVYIGEFSSN